MIETVWLSTLHTLDSSSGGCHKLRLFYGCSNRRHRGQPAPSGGPLERATRVELSRSSDVSLYQWRAAGGQWSENFCRRHVSGWWSAIGSTPSSHVSRRAVVRSRRSSALSRVLPCVRSIVEVELVPVVFLVVAAVVDPCC